MSYFAFGLVSVGGDGSGSPGVRTSSLMACAQRIGLAVSLGGDREPGILAEMRGCVAAHEIPYFCTDDAASDTSDKLISPHVAGMEGAARGLSKIAAWLRCVMREGGHPGAQLWLTEGWDDAFEEWACRPDELEGRLLRRFAEEMDLPSIKVTVVSPPRTDAP